MLCVCVFVRVCNFSGMEVMQLLLATLSCPAGKHT